MQDRLVRFQMFGQEFNFVSDAPEQEVDAVIALLRQELEGNEKINKSSVPSSKMLVLGCLRIAAKYVQLKSKCQETQEAQTQRIEQMIEKVAANLP